MHHFINTTHRAADGWNALNRVARLCGDAAMAYLRIDPSQPGFSFEPAVATSLLRPFSRLKAELPADLAQRLGSLPPHGDDEHVPLRSLIDWLESAGQVLCESDIGLQALAHLERGMGGVVELGAASAATLSDAFAFLSEHVSLLNESVELKVRADGELACCEIRSRVKLPRALRDFQVGALFHALRKWLGDASDCQLWFAHAEPQQATLYHSLFAGSLRFEAPCDGVACRRTRLSEPLALSDSAVHAVLRRHARQLVQVQSRGSKLVPRVRDVLLDLLARGKGDADEVAKRFGMSRRTMTRHLAREGVNFRELLEEVRRHGALRYLETTDVPLTGLATLLGYTETSSFCRAFMRWRGQSPLAYRRAARAKGGASQSMAADIPARVLGLT
jgi:AraC-like DNA-binding protein